MEEKKYIMWSDGVVTSFGELLAKESDTITVKNPVVVMFQVVNEPVFEVDENGQPVLDEVGQPKFKLDENGQPVMRGGLKWDMNPYVFGVCIKNPDDNVWTVSPKSIISEDAEYDARLVGHYQTLIKLCGNVNA